MFLSGRVLGSHRDSFPVVANWENDVIDVVLEACELEEDPSGYRAVYRKIASVSANANASSRDRYCIGASYLKNRLEKLRHAGFEAPMTRKAINMLDQKRLERF